MRESYFQKNISGIMLFFIAIISVLMINFQTTRFILSFKGITSFLIYPFQNGFYSLYKGITGVWSSLNEISRLREELRITREKLAKTEDSIIEYSEIKKENAHLLQLLKMQEKLGFKSIPAVVISKDPSNNYLSLIINKGLADGININMPVVAYEEGRKGFVGKIIEVRSHASKIQTILDGNSYVGGIIETTRYWGLVRGYVKKPDFCTMLFVAREANVEIGDEVMTSGQGGLFPKGIYIGEVISNIKKNYGEFQEILIKPLINFYTIENVFVIITKPNTDVQELLQDSINN